MLTKPTPKQLTALANMSRHSYWGEVEQLLQEELKSIYQRLVDANDEVSMRVLQGSARMLGDLLKTVEVARNSGA